MDACFLPVDRAVSEDHLHAHMNKKSICTDHVELALLHPIAALLLGIDGSIV